MKPLKDSEHHYRQLFDDNPQPMWVYDRTTLAFLAVNEAAIRHYGYSHAEFLAMTIEDLHLPEHRARLLDSIRNLPDQLRNPGVWQHRKKDGTWIEVEIATHELDFNNRPARLVLANDITERRLAERALQDSNLKLQGILDAAPFPILSADAEGHIQSWNKAAERLFGWSSDEVIGLICPTVPPDGIKDYLNMIYRAMRGEASLGLERYRKKKSGELIDVSISVTPQKNSSSQVIGVTIIIENITERKRADTMSAQLAAIVDSSEDAIIGKTLDGTLTSWNSGAERLYGYSAREAIGQPVSFLIPPDHPNELSEILARIKRGESVKHFETERLKKDGQRLVVSLAISPVRDASGQLTGASAIARDITERKQAEEKIRRQLEFLTALSAIDRIITANFDLRFCLSEILTHVIMELGVDAADILIFNSNLQMLEFGAERGFRTKAVSKAQVRMGESYAGRAALDRQFVEIPNLREEPDNLLLTTHLAGEDFVCYYGMPLIARGQVKGVLEVFHRTSLEPNPEWFDYFKTLAGQTAIAIENATLFESLQRSNSELTLAYDATIEGWSRALDLRDRETEGHTRRVTETTVKLARAFGLSEAELVHVRWGALLHDIGKMGVPDEILHKPGPLTDEEWGLMKKHPAFAFEMLAPIRFLRLALDIPYCHHEKWDGTGYPRGLKGAQIPLVARIFAVVDVWDALSSDRPYRPAWTEERVREYIQKSSGSHFDPQAVDIFLQTSDKN